jgi:hypothetical protein
MTTLLESPWPVILFGIAAEVVLGVILLRSGRGVLIWAMAGVLVLMLAGVGLEWLVVTDREQVEATLEGAAAAVAANDRDALLANIHSSATELRRLIHTRFHQLNFTGARIATLEVQNINHLVSPPTARVHIMGIISFEDRRGEIPYKNYRREMTLELRRESDRWLITGFE